MSETNAIRPGLRPRRPLTDISNDGGRHSTVDNKPAPHGAAPLPKSKRARMSGANASSEVELQEVRGQADVPPVPPAVPDVAPPAPAASIPAPVQAAAPATSAQSVVTASASSVTESSLTTVTSEASGVTRVINRMISKLKVSDPAQCTDHIEPMYTYFYHNEEKYAPRPYMPDQRDINPKMRAILVDWIVEVHYKFRLQQPTLWLCVNTLDRFLSISQISRSNLQLVGVASLLIASKFEEIYAPEVKDCVTITDNAYDKAAILGMESQILTTLNYDIMVPTGYHFLIRYLTFIRASDRVRHLACYYAERNLQEYDSIAHKPHKIAAAAVYSALRCENCMGSSGSCWPKSLQVETGLTEEELIPIAKVLIQHVSEEQETASKRRLVSAKKKYFFDKFLAVSSLPLPTFP